MANIADLNAGADPGDPAGPDPIRDGLDTACPYPEPVDVMAVGDNGVDQDRLPPAAFALGNVPA